MGASKFHGTVYVRMNLCIRHMKGSIRNFCSPYRTARYVRFVHKKLLNPHIQKRLRCYIETSTSTSIKNLSRVWPRFTYILKVRLKCTAEKEGAKEGGIYNRTVRGYFNRRLPNGRRCLKRTILFCNVCTKFNKKAYYCKHLSRDCFSINLDSLVTKKLKLKKK